MLRSGVERIREGERLRVSLLGGTGHIGEGLALRLAAIGHRVIVGSRRREKALRAKSEYEEYLGDLGFEHDITAEANPDAAALGDIVVLAVPYQHLEATIEDTYDRFDDQVVVSPVVPLVRGDYYDYARPAYGSAAEEAQALLPDDVPVVSAFHSIPARKLSDLDQSLNYDVVVCGDDPQAKQTIMALAGQINGLRPLDGGPLAVSSMIECLTPLLMNVSKNNDVNDVSILFR